MRQNKCSWKYQFTDNCKCDGNFGKVDNEVRTFDLDRCSQACKENASCTMFVWTTPNNCDLRKDC